MPPEVKISLYSCDDSTPGTYIQYSPRICGIVHIFYFSKILDDKKTLVWKKYLGGYFPLTDSKLGAIEPIDTSRICLSAHKKTAWSRDGQRKPFFHRQFNFPASTSCYCFVCSQANSGVSTFTRFSSGLKALDPFN